MQGQSQKVLSGEAKFGELRDNVDNKLMAEPSSPLDIIPLYLESVWITVEIEKNGNRKFVGVMPTAGNENLPFEEVQDGKNLVRMKTIVLCCLAQNEIEPGESFPYLVSFRSTSFRAGKKLGTIFAKNEVKERDPWSVVLELSVTKTKNDKGTFAVLDVKQKRAATELEVSTAAKWFGKLNQSNVKADYSDMETPEESAAPDSEGKF